MIAMRHAWTALESRPSAAYCRADRRSDQAWTLSSPLTWMTGVKPGGDAVHHFGTKKPKAVPITTATAMTIRKRL